MLRPKTLSRRDTLRLALGAGLARNFTDWNRLFAQGGRPVPTPSQLAWQQDELAMFIHFGVNTFTNREWGDGKEDPAIFNPAKLDVMQWARTARDAGFKAMVLTAKHHDGFCLWPTKTTRHSVVSSPFRGGSGDVGDHRAARQHGDDVGIAGDPGQGDGEARLLPE